MAERNAPIGIFDSGVGGLTVARAIVDQLPDESIIYIGDTANGPYGPQPISRVREHATRIADELVARGCKMLVIACNTASAASEMPASVTTSPWLKSSFPPSGAPWPPPATGKSA